MKPADPRDIKHLKSMTCHDTVINQEQVDKIFGLCLDLNMEPVHIGNVVHGDIYGVVIQFFKEIMPVGEEEL